MAVTPVLCRPISITHSSVRCASTSPNIGEEFFGGDMHIGE